MQWGWALEFAAPEFRADKKLVLKVVRRYGGAIQYAAPTLQADREVAWAAMNAPVMSGGAADFAFNWISDELCADREIALIAIKHDGMWLEHLTPELRNDRKVAMEAIKQNGRALEFAGPVLLEDPGFIVDAIKQNPAIVEFVEEIASGACCESGVQEVLWEYSDDAKAMRKEEARISDLMARETYKGEELSAMGSGRRIASP